ncbi:uncharacterized protein SPSK_10485 [Sporothrix schenckii 1099-18]|uniref:Uncharacterized protein n=1 Tax=Sporothrix schenckii 1099-18 TaxID=1397361 RepID=A0A0F2MEK1_SPOSC|nr:uncharacterized protein SPSK_10485 [Sporothrix schenckii 1099-18]KJR86586.1 hypothetical protein SPSK_10485 [Sporothrix schenckii 1099-18]
MPSDLLAVGCWLLAAEGNGTDLELYLKWGLGLGAVLWTPAAAEGIAGSMAAAWQALQNMPSIGGLGTIHGQHAVEDV